MNSEQLQNLIENQERMGKILTKILEYLDTYDERLNLVVDHFEDSRISLSDVYNKIDDLIDKFPHIRILEDINEKVENNLKSLNRMMTEMKGLISMTRANLPKRGDEF